MTAGTGFYIIIQTLKLIGSKLGSGLWDRKYLVMFWKKESFFSFFSPFLCEKVYIIEQFYNYVHKDFKNM